MHHWCHVIDSLCLTLFFLSLTSTLFTVGPGVIDVTQDIDALQKDAGLSIHVFSITFGGFESDNMFETTTNILLMEEILHQLLGVVYPIIYRVLYIPGGCLGFLPSTRNHTRISQKNVIHQTAILHIFSRTPIIFGDAPGSHGFMLIARFQRGDKSCNNVDRMTIKDSWYLLLGMGP